MKPDAKFDSNLTKRKWGRISYRFAGTVQADEDMGIFSWMGFIAEMYYSQPFFHFFFGKGAKRRKGEKGGGTADSLKQKRIT